MISHRLFLRSTAAAGAVGAVAAPAIAAEPDFHSELSKSPHELISYHADQLAEALGRVDDTRTYRVEISYEDAWVLVFGRDPKGEKS